MVPRRDLGHGDLVVSSRGRPGDCRRWRLWVKVGWGTGRRVIAAVAGRVERGVHVAFMAGWRGEHDRQRQTGVEPPAEAVMRVRVMVGGSLEHLLPRSNEWSGYPRGPPLTFKRRSGVSPRTSRHVQMNGPGIPGDLPSRSDQWSGYPWRPPVTFERRSGVSPRTSRHVPMNGPGILEDLPPRSNEWSGYPRRPPVTFERRSGYPRGPSLTFR